MFMMCKAEKSRPNTDLAKSYRFFSGVNKSPIRFEWNVCMYFCVSFDSHIIWLIFPKRICENPKNHSLKFPTSFKKGKMKLQLWNIFCPSDVLHASNVFFVFLLLIYNVQFLWIRFEKVKKVNTGNRWRFFFSTNLDSEQSLWTSTFRKNEK